MSRKVSLAKVRLVLKLASPDTQPLDSTTGQLVEDLEDAE